MNFQIEYFHQVVWSFIIFSWKYLDILSWFLFSIHYKSFNISKFPLICIKTTTLGPIVDIAVLKLCTHFELLDISIIKYLCNNLESLYSWISWRDCAGHNQENYLWHKETRVSALCCDSLILFSSPT